MADDNDDEKLPVPRSTSTAMVPANGGTRPMLPKVGGVVDATLTGWRARATAKTYREVGNALDATKGAVSAGIGLKRELDRLGDLDNILDEDQKQRDHERWTTERARQADRVQADYDDQLRVFRNEAELAQAKDQALYHQRRLAAATETKDMLIKSTVHKVGTETHSREVKFLTAQEAARRRREQLAGGRAGPAEGAPDPTLLGIIDAELRAAHANGDPVHIIIWLATLKTAATTPESLVAAIDEQGQQAVAAGEPYEVGFRLASLRAAFTET